MATATDTTAIDRLRARLARVESSLLNPQPLLVSMMKIIVEDNRRGVLAGTDKDGGYMLAVTYRPVGKAKGTTAARRNLANGRLRKSSFAGLGIHAAGLHNNLTREEYERLGGPPLAPRRASSRVITNLETGWQRSSDREWEAYGYWDEVVCTRGVPFLHAHFTGASTGRGHRVHLPTRDLRGVRPEGRELARRATIAWMRDVLRAVHA